MRNQPKPASADTTDAKPRSVQSTKGAKRVPVIRGIPNGDIKTVPLQEIDFDNTDLEFRVDRRLKDLVDDIAKNGQQFPVLLRKQADSDRYQIVSGFRRCRAIAQLEWPTIQAIIREDLDDDDAYRVSFLENERRRNLTGADKANAIAKLRIRGKTDAEIMELYGIGPRQLERYRQVSTFPAELTRAVLDKLVDITHALILNRATVSNPDEVDLDYWLTRIVHEKLSARTLTRLLNQKYGKKRSKKRYLDRYKDGGFRLFPMKFDPSKTPSEDKEEMLSLLKDALDRLESVQD